MSLPPNNNEYPMPFPPPGVRMLAPSDNAPFYRRGNSGDRPPSYVRPEEEEPRISPDRSFLNRESTARPSSMSMSAPNTLTRTSGTRLSLATLSSMSNLTRAKEAQFQAVNEWCWDKEENIKPVAARHRVRISMSPRRRSEQIQLLVPRFESAEPESSNSLSRGQGSCCARMNGEESGSSECEACHSNSPYPNCRYIIW